MEKLMQKNLRKKQMRSVQWTMHRHLRVRFELSIDMKTLGNSCDQV